MNSLIATPEKRKVGGSTPPLTTSDDQQERPGQITVRGFLISGDSNSDSNAYEVSRQQASML